MLRAALGYVAAGWPIVPGATAYNQPGRGWVRRMLGAGSAVSVRCSCGSPDCRCPAAHPLDPDWQRNHISTEQAARFWWGSQHGPMPNIMLCCGESFDVWSVPAQVGSVALDLIDGGAAPVVPVAITPLWRWHFFTAPTMPGHRVQVPPGLDVVHLGEGRFVPAPPSTRGTLGHDRWLVEQRRRLPLARPITAALILAAERITGGHLLTEGDRDRSRD